MLEALEPGLVDEPARGDLDRAPELELRHIRESSLQLGCLLTVDDRVLEKAAGVSDPGGIREAVAAELEDLVIDVKRREIPLLPHALQRLVADMGNEAPREAESDGGDEASGKVGLEPAHPVAEAALLRGKALAGAVLVHDLDILADVGELAPVGADVLHRGSAAGPGDQGKVLDAGEPAAEAPLDRLLPALAGGEADYGVIRGLPLNRDAAGGHDVDRPREVLAEEHVGAAAQDEPRAAVADAAEVVLDAVHQHDVAGAHVKPERIVGTKAFHLILS